MTPEEQKMSNAYQIDKGVPLPKEGHHKYLDRYWNKMEIGDSILLSLQEKKKLRQCLLLALKDESYGLYKARKEGNWYRLWKVKERGRRDEKEYSDATKLKYSYLKKIEGGNNGRS